MIAAGAIIGYGDEEFTHQAVAAVIASGRADAGLGAHSAAARFALDFLPLGEECYFLIDRVSGNRGTETDRLVAAVSRIKGAFDGYT